MECATKVGQSLLIVHGTPAEPSTSLRMCRLQHSLADSGVFILYVEASRFVAEVIGQKTKFGVNWYFVKEGMFLYCSLMKQWKRFLFFSIIKDWQTLKEVEVLWYFSAY